MPFCRRSLPRLGFTTFGVYHAWGLPRLEFVFGFCWLGQFIPFGCLPRLGICHSNSRSLPRLEFTTFYHRHMRTFGLFFFEGIPHRNGEFPLCPTPSVVFAVPALGRLLYSGVSPPPGAMPGAASRAEEPRMRRLREEEKKQPHAETDLETDLPSRPRTRPPTTTSAPCLA